MNEIMYIVSVLLIYGSIVAGLIYFAVKRTRLFMILLGIIAILGAVPVAFMAEIGINGCCGAPPTGYEGSGYVIGALVGAIGVVLIVASSRFKKRKSVK